MILTILKYIGIFLLGCCIFDTIICLLIARARGAFDKKGKEKDE